MIKAPRGTRDIFHPESDRWRFIEETFATVSTLFGYSELRTPIFEKRELFERSVGETSDIVQKEMYVFEDRKGREFALRPEGTASIVRAYLESNLGSRMETSFPGGISRFFYCGPMFRYERPQAGRSRQFHQIGVESFGVPGWEADAEVIELLALFLETVGIESVIELGSVGCEDCRPAYRETLLKFADRYRGDFCPQCSERLDRNPLRIFDCKVESCRRLLDDAPTMFASCCDVCRSHLDGLQGFLSTAGIGFEVNPRLVRGLDYYTRSVFEVRGKNLGSQDALAAGGRYDGLVGQFGGTSVPGVGFAAGLERLVISAGEGLKSLVPPTVFAFHLEHGSAGYVSRICSRLRSELNRRKASCRIVRDLRDRTNKPGKVLGQMDRHGVEIVLFAGKKEEEEGSLVLKHLGRGEQVSVTPDTLCETLCSPGWLLDEHP